MFSLSQNLTLERIQLYLFFNKTNFFQLNDGFFKT